MSRWPFLIVAAAALTGMQDAGTGNSGSTGATAATMPEGDQEAGFELYAAGCRACHSGAIAPTLKGVFGRQIAGVEGYAYSEGLKARSAENWNAANLDLYLTSPEAFAAGAKMKKRLSDPQERADVVAFLETLTE